MKKNIIITSILSLLTLSGCVTFDDPVNDPYRSPDLFYAELVKYYNKNQYCIDREGWRINSTKLAKPHTDYSGRMASHLKDIKEFKEVKSIEESGDYFTYRFNCIECPLISMTVYDSGYIVIKHPLYITGGEYYYSIDAELATSIHTSMIEEVSYYSNLEDEEKKYTSNVADCDYFFDYIEGTKGEVDFNDRNVTFSRVFIDCEQELRESLKEIDYKFYTNQDVSEKKFVISLENSSRRRSFKFILYNSLEAVELKYSGRDEAGRQYNANRKYAVTPEDGQKIYDIVLEYTGVTITEE